MSDDSHSGKLAPCRTAKLEQPRATSAREMQDSPKLPYSIFSVPTTPALASPLPESIPLSSRDSESHQAEPAYPPDTARRIPPFSRSRDAETKAAPHATAAGLRGSMSESIGLHYAGSTHSLFSQPSHTLDPRPPAFRWRQDAHVSDASGLSPGGLSAP